MRALRIGIIGAGAVATRHAQTLTDFGDASVVGVADPVAERAGRLAALVGATPYQTHEQLLDGGRLDAVYICVPPFAHGAPERAVIGAGLPFFVEKPLAADLATAERVAGLLEGGALVTATGYHWRALDTLQRSQELLAGRPAWLALGSWLDKVPPPAWWSRRELSGGQTVEQATHILDVLRCLVGEVTQVHALGHRAPRAVPEGTGSVGPAPGEGGAVGEDVDEVGAATLRFASGAVGSLVSSCLLGWHDRMGVELVAEGMRLELTERELLVRTSKGRLRYPAQGDARARTDRDFLDAVLGRRAAVRAPYREALRTHRLACAIASSAEEGRPVGLEAAAHA